MLFLLPPSPVTPTLSNQNKSGMLMMLMLLGRLATNLCITMLVGGRGEESNLFSQITACFDTVKKQL